jgi:hypothetical protein
LAAKYAPSAAAKAAHPCAAKTAHPRAAEAAHPHTAAVKATAAKSAATVAAATVAATASGFDPRGPKYEESNCEHSSERFQCVLHASLRPGDQDDGLVAPLRSRPCAGRSTPDESTCRFPNQQMK